MGFFKVGGRVGHEGRYFYILIVCESENLVKNGRSRNM